MNKKNFKRPHYIRIHIQKIKDSPKEIIGMRGGGGMKKNRLVLSVTLVQENLAFNDDPRAFVYPPCRVPPC